MGIFSSAKTVIEFLGIMVQTYLFITDQISEARYRASVNKRKESYKKFISGDRKTRLEVLRDENNEDS